MAPEIKVPKIKVVQWVYGGYTKNYHWFRLVELINSLYCRHRGYDYVVQREEVPQNDSERFRHLQRQLTDCDYLLSLDADACFYDLNLSVQEELLPLLPVSKDILVTDNLYKDWEGISDGVFFIRNTAAAHYWLDCLFDRIKNGIYDACDGERHAAEIILNNYLDETQQGNVHIQSPCDPVQAVRGYFIRHLAGHQDQYRAESFKRILQRFIAALKLAVEIPKVITASNPQYYITPEHKVFIPQLEMDIVKGCNLRCKHCTHFSPYQKGIIPTQDLILWSETWVKKIQPKHVRLLGGEPLLHPDLAHIVIEMRRIWGDVTPLMIFTNGLLINTIPQSVLDAIREAKITVVISDHSDTDVKHEDVFAGVPRLVESGIIYGSESSAKHWYVSSMFDENSKPLPFKSDPKKARLVCHSSVCTNLMDNKLYKCPTIANAVRCVRDGIFSKEGWEDALDYQPITPDMNILDILEHLSGAENAACSICPAYQFLTIPSQHQNV